MAGEESETPLTSSIPAGNDTVWTDVSSLLRLACDNLQNDELITGENFNLFAAMSALEIMDPKMDSGIVSTYCSVDEAIDNGAAPVPLSFDRTLDVQRAIDIVDHLLVCEATWHKGGLLSQTVFSCIYLMRPERTSSHALLHSFCRVIRVTCNAVVSAVSDARTNEEEDLFTMAYGLPLKAEGDEKCLSILHVVEETISRQLKACKSSLSKKRVMEDIEPLQMNLDLEEGLCKAILCRLRFRKHFYHVLSCLRRPQGRGLELAKKHITCCLSELESMLKSEDFLSANFMHENMENRKEDKTTASGCLPIGFDTTLNSRSAAPTPPRAVKLLSWKMAVHYFQKLLHDLNIVCSCSLDPTLESVLHFVAEFQKSQPDLVSRAHIQLLLVQDGKLYGRESMFSVICNAALLLDGAKGHDIQKNESITQLVQLLISTLRILCTNVAWQRRKLGKILQDWRLLFVQLDLAFRSGDITSTSTSESSCLKICKHILVWTDQQTYWTALRFLLLGFELELYSSSEYCMVYWYIHSILIKLAEKTQLKMMLGAETNHRKSKDKRYSVKISGKEHHIHPVVLLLQCYIHVAEGLMKMLVSLRNENKMFVCFSPFNSERERFMQHFELLQKACLPDHVSYFSFRESTIHARSSTVSTHSCFNDAHRLAKDLRGYFSSDPDKMAEIRRLEQVAEHNNVALNLLCRLGTLEPSLKVSFQFTHHPHFATASVKRS